MNYKNIYPRMAKAIVCGPDSMLINDIVDSVFYGKIDLEDNQALRSMLERTYEAYLDGKVNKNTIRKVEQTVAYTVYRYVTKRQALYN